jgi:hypothetical protein
MVVGDEIKTIVLGLQLEMLAHCAEEIAYMKSPGRLYARKNSQIDLLTPIDDIGTKILWKFCAKITTPKANVKDFALSLAFAWSRNTGNA